MLITVEVEVDINGNVRLLEPVTITKTSWAIVTLLDADASVRQAVSQKAKNGGVRELFGSASLGHPTGTDNGSIDADLTAEYANNHDE